ncbi:MAG: vWA domain-containing protein, partial [Planctomycetota bacterium]
MQEFLKWLAGIGDEALPPTESLKFEFLAVPQGGFGLAMLLGFLLVSVGILLIYRRDAARLSLRRRATLAVLRVLALLSVALVLLEPSLVRIRRVVRPGEVLLLLDTSQSMGHRDSYARSRDWEAAWQAVGASSPAELSRLELASKLLGPDGCMAVLAEKNLVRPYLFGAGLRPAPVAAPATEATPRARPEAGTLPPPQRLELGKILASDGSTNPSAAIRQALEASRETRIPALILISDGRKNVGGSFEEVGAYLRRRKVENVLIVGVGDPAEARMMSVKDVQAAERIFKGDPVKVSALVGAEGYDETNVQVKLWEVLEKEPKLLAQTTAGVGGDLGVVEVEFPALRLETEGMHLLQVEIRPRTRASTRYAMPGDT